MKQDRIVFGIEENRKHQRPREAYQPLFSMQSGFSASVFGWWYGVGKTD
jgi:hypothetical protein